MYWKESKKGLTRRGFIKGAGLGAGAIALTGLGLKEVKGVPYFPGFPRQSAQLTGRLLFGGLC